MRRKLITLLAGLALVVGGVLTASAGSASAAVTTPIRSQHNTSLCLTAAHFNQGDGGSVHMALCNGASSQQWIVNGFEIRNAFNGKCLDAAFGNSDNGASIEVYTCHGGAPQQWYRPYGGAIRSWMNGNRCVEISGANYWQGAGVQLWDCPTYQPWQRWTMAY